MCNTHRFLKNIGGKCASYTAKYGNKMFSDAEQNLEIEKESRKSRKTSKSLKIISPYMECPRIKTTMYIDGRADSVLFSSDQSCSPPYKEMSPLRTPLTTQQLLTPRPVQLHFVAVWLTVTPRVQAGIYFPGLLTQSRPCSYFIQYSNFRYMLPSFLFSIYSECIIMAPLKFCVGYLYCL